MELDSQLESRKRGRPRSSGEKTLSSEDITKLLLSTSAGLKVVKVSVSEPFCFRPIVFTSPLEKPPVKSTIER